MKRTLYNPLIIIALVFAFLMVALPIDAATGSKYFKDKWTDGADIYGTQTSGLFIVSVTGDVSGQTQFSVSSFKGNYFYKADYFNNIYTVRMIDPSGSITVGSEALITDFDPSSGIFTTGAIGANYAVGDRIALMWDVLGLGGGSGSTGIKLRSVTNIMTLTDADTTWSFTVNDSACTITRIEFVITTANQAATTNVQMVSKDATGVDQIYSMSADLDFNAIAIGTHVNFDLSNFTNAPVTTLRGQPVASSDFNEESCDVFPPTTIGFETGESPTTNAVANVTIWYYTNGTGSITAIAP